MSDAELIAMARLAQRDERMSTGALYGDLADRIENLGKACTEWAEVSQSNYQRAKAAEAKLAKAMEALRYYAVEALPWDADDSLVARTTLAELEGE